MGTLISLMTRHKVAFGALVLTQAAHSVEEYVGRLWETFLLAWILTGLVSQDQERGFLWIRPRVGGIRRLVFCVAHPPRVADGSVACLALGDD